MEDKTKQWACPETQGYEMILCGHMQQMSYRLRQMSPEQWDYTPDPAAPTSRTLATHAFQWLTCDRYHIYEADASKHPRVPDAPTDPQEMCDAFDVEIQNWRQMLRSLTAEDLNAPRRQFNNLESDMNVRGFILHMIQNCIYKHGQMSTLFFALGLDGTEPYDAPFPNPIYEELFGPREAESGTALAD